MLTGKVEMLQPKKGRPPKPTKPHVEPTDRDKDQKCNESKTRKRIYLDTILILQSSPQNTQNRIRLEIHHQIRTTRKYPESALSQGCTSVGHLRRWTLGLDHTKGLCLESMPWSTTYHALIRKIADSIDCLPSNMRRYFMREREQEETFESS